MSFFVIKVPMAKFRQIHVKIWKDDWFWELEPNHKLLYIYLFSNERATTAGIYELSKRVMSYESGLSPQEIDAAFDVFSRDQKAWYDSGVIFIPNLRKYHENNSANCQKGIINEYNDIPSCPLKAHYNTRYGLEEDTRGLKGLEGACKPPINLNLNNNHNDNLNIKEGGVGGEIDAIVTAICNIARAGALDPKTLDKATEFYKAGITPDRVLAFGPWWSQYSDNGKPYLPNLTTFWDDFENDRAPHFVKNNSNKAEQRQQQGYDVVDQAIAEMKRDRGIE